MYLNNSAATVIATTAGGLGNAAQVVFNSAGNTLDLRGAAIGYTSGINSANNGGTITVEPTSAGAGVTTDTLTLANTLGSQTITVSPGATFTTTNSNYSLTLASIICSAGNQRCLHHQWQWHRQRHAELYRRLQHQRP